MRTKKCRRARGIGRAADMFSAQDGANPITPNAATQQRQSDLAERRRRARWARELMLAVFGWRHGKASIQAGFVYRVVNQKWDDFEDVFFGFPPEKIVMLSPEQLDEILESPIITRHIDDLSPTDRPEEEPDKDESCKVRGHIELDFTPQGVLWPLYNKRAEPTSIAKLEFTWPSYLGSVKAVSVGDTRVAPTLYRDAGKGSLTIDFPASTGPVVEETADLKISFQPLISSEAYPPLHQGDFTLEISFVGECSTKLVPGYENNHEDFY